MFYRCIKVQHKPIKDWRIGFKFKGARNRVCSGLAYRTVRCTRTVQSPNTHSRVSQSALRSAIIHRTVRCATKLSGAPAEQRLFGNTVDCKSVDAELQCANSACRSQCSRQRRTGQWTVPVRCSTGLFGSTRRQSLKRSEAPEP
jgi:FAD synthase